MEDEVEESSNEIFEEEDHRAYTKWPDMIRNWPKTTLVIVSNEFCERFSYYGMRTVLVLYMMNILKYSHSTATTLFSCFNILCYTTPLLGSIIADGFIGKFWTIFSVSIVYAVGQVVLALASISKPDTGTHPWLDFLGLIIIAFGTGGIKPCVSAFGGDQFDPKQERMISLYFSLFYFSINAGSTISSFVSPIFRARPCLGQDSCYPLAFGIPAILMVCATIIFMAGSPWYKKVPPKENIFGEVFYLVVGAVKNKAKTKENKEHWLDHYMTTHKCKTDSRCIVASEEDHNSGKCHKGSLILDVKGLLRVLVMFLPVPMFWALYDQQASVWTIQAIQMDCRVGSVLVLPDQMQTLNAVLILIFIPLFQVVVYPFVGRFCKVTPLRKMVTGGFLAGLAFIVTGIIQTQINKTLPSIPGSNEVYISVWNQLPSSSDCSISFSINGRVETMRPGMALSDDKTKGNSTFHVKRPQKNMKSWNVTVSMTPLSASCPADIIQMSYSFEVEGGTVYYVAASPSGTYHATADPSKPDEGTGEFSMGITSALDEKYRGNFAMCRLDTSDFDPNTPCDPEKPSDFYYWERSYNFGVDDLAENATYTPFNFVAEAASVYTFKAIKPGNWGLFFMNNTPKSYAYKSYNKYQTQVSDTGVRFSMPRQGGVYVMALTGSFSNMQHTIWEVVQTNSVNIMWQIPQYIIMTAAEILFSVTGYEFAYSQAAPSMKALVQACWLLTTAIGDSIIAVISALNLFSDMAVQFFIYAGVMLAVIGIFALLAIFYYDYKETEESQDGSEQTDSEKIDDLKSDITPSLHSGSDKPLTQ